MVKYHHRVSRSGSSSTDQYGVAPSGSRPTYAYQARSSACIAPLLPFNTTLHLYALCPLCVEISNPESWRALLWELSDQSLLEPVGGS